MLEDVTGTRLAFTLPGEEILPSDGGKFSSGNANSFDAYEADDTKVLYKYRKDT